MKSHASQLRNTPPNSVMKSEFSNWISNLHSENFQFFVTFRSRPVVSRQQLEGGIKEWSKRINKKIIGRNWSKDSHQEYRMEGIVFFENSPDLHAHAIIKPPVSINHSYTIPKMARILKNQWSIDFEYELGKYGFRKQTDYEIRQDRRAVKNCINSAGDCHVQQLNTPNDARNVSHYSLKQSNLFSQAMFDDFKFISDLESCRTTKLRTNMTH